MVDLLKIGKSIMEHESEAIRLVAASLDESFTRTVQRLYDTKGRIIVTGVGKAGLVGRKISATFASTGAPSYFLHPADALHGDLGMVTPEDVVLALSNRGQSDDVLRIIPYLKHFRVDLIAVTSNPKSELARHADYLLVFPKLEEACPLGLAPTSSSTAMLALGDAMALVLLEMHGFKRDQFAMSHPSGALGKRLLTRVRDVLPDYGENPVVRDQDSFKDVLIVMTSTNRGAVSVVGGDGKLVGIVTDGDVKRILTLPGYHIDMKIADVMTANPVTTRMDDMGVRALDRMEQRRTTVLPVTDDEGRPVAMLNVHDLILAGIAT